MNLSKPAKDRSSYQKEEIVKAAVDAETARAIQARKNREIERKYGVAITREDFANRDKILGEKLVLPIVPHNFTGNSFDEKFITRVRLLNAKLVAYREALRATTSDEGLPTRAQADARQPASVPIEQPNDDGSQIGPAVGQPGGLHIEVTVFYTQAAKYAAGGGDQIKKEITEKFVPLLEELRQEGACDSYAFRIEGKLDIQNRAERVAEAFNYSDMIYLYDGDQSRNFIRLWN